MKSHQGKYMVRVALAEDINAPYIWFSELPCESRAIVKVVHREKSVWCEVIKSKELENH